MIDLGCGNGNAAIWLAQQTGCEVVGVDLSQVRVDNAQDKANSWSLTERAEFRNFETESMCALVFPKN